MSEFTLPLGHLQVEMQFDENCFLLNFCKKQHLVDPSKHRSQVNIGHDTQT